MLPALLQVEARASPPAPPLGRERVATSRPSSAAIQAEIDERCFELYGIDEDDRRAITEGFGVESAEATPSEATPMRPSDEDEQTTRRSPPTTTGLAAELVSWAVGVAFGRFDVRLATGARPLPAEPEPFDPLPVCSPAMLTGDDGLPLRRATAGYPLAFPRRHPRRRPGPPARSHRRGPRGVRRRLRRDADALVERGRSAARPEGPRPARLARDRASSRITSSSTRRAVARRRSTGSSATPSARYSVWLYIHRLTRDSFSASRTTTSRPKLAHEERRLDEPRSERWRAVHRPSERKELAAQEAFVEELRASSTR